MFGRDLIEQVRADSDTTMHSICAIQMLSTISPVLRLFSRHISGSCPILFLHMLFMMPFPLRLSFETHVPKRNLYLAWYTSYRVSIFIPFGILCSIYIGMPFFEQLLWFEVRWLKSRFINRVQLRSKENFMNARNLGVVFGREYN